MPLLLVVLAYGSPYASLQPFRPFLTETPLPLTNTFVNLLKTLTGFTYRGSDTKTTRVPKKEDYSLNFEDVKGIEMMQGGRVDDTLSKLLLIGYLLPKKKSFVITLKREPENRVYTVSEDNVNKCWHLSTSFVPGYKILMTEDKINWEIDSDRGRLIYSKRIGTAEPVFANLRHALGLNRFTLRGDGKVNIQLKLFSIVHNLLKVHRFGPGFA